MIGNLLKYTCAKNCHNRWSSDKAIAKIKLCSFLCLAWVYATECRCLTCQSPVKIENTASAQCSHRQQGQFILRKKTQIISKSISETKTDAFIPIPRRSHWNLLIFITLFM